MDPDIGSIFHFVKVTQIQGGSCVLKVGVKKRLAFSVQFFKKVPRPDTCVKVFSLCAKFSFLKWLACVETRLPSDKTLLESRTHNIWFSRSRQIKLGNIGNVGNGNIWAGQVDLSSSTVAFCISVGNNDNIWSGRADKVGQQWHLAGSVCFSV